MNKKELFYKAIVWQIIGFLWISILSNVWFGSWIRSLTFSIVLVVVSVFVYILYELAWNKIIKNKKNETFKTSKKKFRTKFFDRQKYYK